MARPRKYFSDITKFRMNRGWETPRLAKEARISQSTIHHIENGKPMTRPVVSRYLGVLEIDLNDIATLPPGWVIEERSEKVVILSNN